MQEVYYRTLLEQLRAPPTHSNARTLVSALERIKQIRTFTVSNLDLEHIAENRLAVLVRNGLTSKAAWLSVQSQERCFATLAVTMRYLEFQAVDEALMVFDLTMRKLGLRAQKRIEKERLRSMGDLDQAALILRDAVRLILDPAITPKQLRLQVKESIGESILQQAVLRVTEITSVNQDSESQIWQKTYREIGKFINALLETIPFAG